MIRTSTTRSASGLSSRYAGRVKVCRSSPWTDEASIGRETYTVSDPPGTVARMEQELVLRDVGDGVAVLTLNRPDRLNAWTHALENRYFDRLHRSARRPVRSVFAVTGP